MSSSQLPPLDPLAERGLNLTRRRFFGLGAKTLGAGLGAMALHSLAPGGPLFAAPATGPGASA